MLVSAPCRVCGAATRPHLSVRGHDLFRCDACGYVQVDPVPSEAELAAIYGSAYFEKSRYVNDTAQAREQDRRAALLEAAGVARGARLLDFGCATGNFLARVKDSYEVYGVDVSADAIERAKVLIPDIAGRLGTISLDEPALSSFPLMDCIVAWDVIEHLGDPMPVLQVLASHLKPGGILAVSTPDIGALTARLMKGRWAFMTPPEHLGFFDAKSTGKAFDLAGVALDKVVSHGRWANVAFFAYKLRRVFPEWVPEASVRRISTSWVGRRCLYVPTTDVLYAVGHKRT